MTYFKIHTNTFLLNMGSSVNRNPQRYCHALLLHFAFHLLRAGDLQGAPFSFEQQCGRNGIECFYLIRKDVWAYERCLLVFNTREMFLVLCRSVTRGVPPSGYHFARFRISVLFACCIARARCICLRLHVWLPPFALNTYLFFCN